MNDLQRYLDNNLMDVKFSNDDENINEDVEKELADSIIFMRQKKGLTQEDLSKITGIQQSSISKIENCNGNPSLKKLKKIAKGLNCKLVIRME